MQVEERGCDKGIERRKRWIEQSGLRRGKFGKMGLGRDMCHSSWRGAPACRWRPSGYLRRIALSRTWRTLSEDGFEELD